MIRWKDKGINKLDKNSLTKNWGTYTVLLLALGAMTFFGVCNPSQSQFSGPTGAAASVAGNEISNVEFRRAYSNAYQQYQRQYGDAFDPAALNLSGLVLDQLVDQRILYEEALRNGVFATDAEVEKVILDAEVFKDESGKFSGERFDQFLRGNRYSEASFMDEIRRSLTLDKFRRFVTDSYHVSNETAKTNWRLAETKYNVEYLKFTPTAIEVTVTPEEVEAFLATDDGKKQVDEYYESHKSEFQKGKKVKARHLLVSYKDARNASGEAKERSKDDAKAKAEQYLAEVKAPGADFAAIASKYTDDPSGKKNGGDLGFFDREAMVKEFSDVAFGLKQGEISGVVESPFGFHIIKVDAIQEAENTDLEHARKGIAEKLLAKDKKPKLLEEKAKAALQALATGGSAEDVIKPLKIEWKETGEFAADARFVPGLGAEEALKQAALSLTQEKKLYPEIVTAGDAKYILRLKSLKLPDPAKFDESKLEDMVQTAKFTDGFGVFSELTASAKERYKGEGKIWINEDYRTLDQQRQAGPQGS